MWCAICHYIVDLRKEFAAAVLLPSGSYSPVKMLDLDCSSEPQLRICILFMGIFKILE